MRTIRCHVHSLRLAQIVFCIVMTTVSLFASNLQAQNTQVTGTKSGRLAAPSLGAGWASGTLRNLSFSVSPKLKKFMDAWVEYYPSTCTLASSGSWTVTTPPTQGDTSSGILIGTLGNGDCPGITFPFAAIYYRWTSKGPSGATSDSFAATWTSTDFQVQDAVALTLIVPVNYQQTGPGVARPGGVLHFDYTWASNTGNLADLAQCEVGENVRYPGTGNAFPWPSPPYLGSTNNPTIIWLPATLGALQDNHSHAPFLEPYVANAFNAHQAYRYKCRTLETVTFPGWGGITLARTVSDSTGKGCWGYTVIKSGASASVSPLPNVSPSSCTPGANHEVPPTMPGPKSGDGIALAVALPEASIGSGEPIFLDLTVFNRGAEPVVVDLGLNKKANLELTIWEPAGGVTTRRLSSEGIGASGEVSVPSGEERAQRLLLNEWYEFRQIGTYRIQMTLLDDPFVTSGAADADRPSTEFSVVIGPRDPAQLERVCQELADRAIGGATLEESMDAANALSYIRDPLAVESLVRVLQEGSLVEHYAVDGLGRIGSPEAIAALEAAQGHPDEEVRAAVRRVLDVLQGRPQQGAPDS
jgi:hypothetical protein